ncbi:hypothetical protein CK203_112306 [Vitis vinifera]|uniref:Reverse transcriptase/retrotransposon-derived protein RNase H-like domain-containing protein n=1 Tax=Vitis vinifera TaxID=29760 RepID=A0A438C543_VITVI|nr:hypothetical protein CK203_112306 [Vitis vinifera]
MYNYAYQDDDAPTFYVNLSAANHMRNDLCNNVYVKPYKRGQFEWPEEVENAFKPLKHAMTSILTLTMPNLNEPSMIKSDASGEGIGAVLTQQGKPIAFMS